VRLETNPLYPPWSAGRGAEAGLFRTAFPAALSRGGTGRPHSAPRGLDPTTPSVKASEGPEPLRSDGGVPPPAPRDEG